MPQGQLVSITLVHFVVLTEVHGRNSQGVAQQLIGNISTRTLRHIGG